MFHVRRFLFGRQPRSLPRVDADDDDLVVAPRLERQCFQRPHDSVEDLGAQHRAVVVREREDDRPPAEVVADPDVPPRLVAEPQVRRHLMADPLIDADLLENPRLLGRRIQLRRLGAHRLGARQRGRHQHGQQRCGCRGLAGHLHVFWLQALGFEPKA